jgi:Fur family ferric uptake transcriptional regulator
VKNPEVTKAINEMHLRRFRKDGFTLYVYGICSTCQAKLTRQKKQKTTKTVKKV